MVNLINEEKDVAPDFGKLKVVFINSLEFFIQAYKNMLEQFPLAYKKENDINNKLFLALNDLLISEVGNSQLTVIPQAYDPRAQEKFGNASQVDFAILWDAGQKNEKYKFFIECKRLCFSKKNAYRTTGIKRYCEGFYSPNVPFGGMIGYIEDSNVDELVKGINKKLNGEEIKFSSKYYWKSSHLRVDNSSIDLYHIFLDFRDCQKNIIQNNEYSRIEENRL